MEPRPPSRTLSFKQCSLAVSSGRFSDQFSVAVLGLRTCFRMVSSFLRVSVYFQVRVNVLKLSGLLRLAQVFSDSVLEFSKVLVLSFFIGVVRVLSGTKRAQAGLSDTWLSFSLRPGGTRRPCKGTLRECVFFSVPSSAKVTAGGLDSSRPLQTLFRVSLIWKYCYVFICFEARDESPPSPLRPQTQAKRLV